jgi:hypothetical protein
VFDIEQRGVTCPGFSPGASQNRAHVVCEPVGLCFHERA